MDEESYSNLIFGLIYLSQQFIIKKNFLIVKDHKFKAKSKEGRLMKEKWPLETKDMPREPLFLHKKNNYSSYSPFLSILVLLTCPRGKL